MYLDGNFTASPLRFNYQRQRDPFAAGIALCSRSRYSRISSA